MTGTIPLDELNSDQSAFNVKRDRWGRYLLPHPDTGQEMAWTRATTVARTLADNFALEKWMQRNLVFGIGKRNDLYAQAASVASIDEKDTLTKIVDQAFEAAESNSKANLGSALHRFTERVDGGEAVDVPAQWAGDVSAYTAKLAEHQISVVPGWMERILIVPEIQTAGTVDRLLQCPAWAQHRIGDLKTGSNPERNMGEFALQLAIYAHATHWWDGSEYHPITGIDQHTAVIMHLPASTGQCALWDVDIAAGWEAVQVAMWVRNWRTRKDLCVPTEKPADESAPEYRFGARSVWIKQRIETIVAAGHSADIAGVWNAKCPDVPTFRQGGPISNAQIDDLAVVCSLVEMTHQMEFPDVDPAKEKTQTSMIKGLL